MVDGQSSERTPLLAQPQHDADQEVQHIDFSKQDEDDPRQWPRRTKMINVAIISLMAVVSPLCSSMFSPVINDIAEDLHAPVSSVIGASTGYVITMGIGPIILAPLSETFGRRIVYFCCYGIFCLLQIPTAISPNVETLIVLRVLCGFMGSCGIACGGGTINDMFAAHERAGVFGWYLLGPVIGPVLGPLLGGLVTELLNWRWIFWIAVIISLVNMALALTFLRETFAPVILERKANALAQEHGGRYTFPGQDPRPLHKKIARALIRPVKIITTQPIVMIMALYQAILFASMYSLYANLQTIYRAPPHNFTTSQVGCLFIFQGVGYLIAVWFIVPKVDTIYNRMTANNDGVSKPEFRLPLANIGAVLLPISLFWFAWTVELRTYWLLSISSTTIYGLGQVCIFNTVQNYYIDTFTTFSASAIAAGAFIRSLAGGLVPIASPMIFEKLGYGWGWSIFAGLALLLAPSPLLFMRYGEKIRTKFSITEADL